MFEGRLPHARRAGRSGTHPRQVPEPPRLIDNPRESKPAAHDPGMTRTPFGRIAGHSLSVGMSSGTKCLKRPEDGPQVRSIRPAKPEIAIHASRRPRPAAHRPLR